MDVPQFLLRKLYKKGSLRETEGGFSFVLQNPLATATLTTAPEIVVNGIAYLPEEIRADFDLTKLPLQFDRGTQWELAFQGRLLKGGNRIHFHANTEQFGDINFLVEDSRMEEEEE